MKRCPVLTLLALFTLTLAAPPALAFERVGDKKILVFAGRQEVPTIDPSVKYDWSIRMMQQGLYDALVKYVGNPPEIVPWLAERWEASPDARTWTFHLTKNARFHNGDPVTAEAVRWSFARTLTPSARKIASNFASSAIRANWAKSRKPVLSETAGWRQAARWWPVNKRKAPRLI